MKKCSTCSEKKPSDAFGKDLRATDGLQSRCRECGRASRRARYASDKHYREKLKAKTRLYARENKKSVSERGRKWREENVERCLWQAAKRRAQRGGIPFDICPEDIVIPKVCPALAIPIQMATGASAPNSPSIDRLVPELGYVKGNIRVISHRANTIKSDASLEELLLITLWVSSQT